MWNEHPGFLYERDDEVANRRTASLGGLAIALFLVVLGLFLVRGLHVADTILDCRDAGQINCDPDTGMFNATSDLIRAVMQSMHQFNS
jgi:hypothetical protein